MRKKIIFVMMIVFIVIVAAVIMIAMRYPSVDAEMNLEELTQEQTIELTCIVESEEKAKQIAEDYGIVLKSFSEKVAVYESDKPYQEIRDLGEKHGLEELFINMTNKKFFED